jgi:ribosomal protein S18 acetylase RimI-like enzyme
MSCLRDRRLSGYALAGEAGVRGYCFFFYDGEKGILGDLFVHPELDGLGYEQMLLDHAVETLLGTPGLCRVEAQLPHYPSDQLEPCLRPHHFQTFLRQFMGLELAGRPPAIDASAGDAAPGERMRRAGIELVPWDKRWHDAAATMLYEAYREHVDAHINDQYASVLGATRLIENIFHNQGCGDFLPHISRLAVQQRTRELAGMLTITEVRPRTAHIPQVAVGPSFQGLGVGTTMMEAAFRNLAEEGFKEVTLTVTDSNAGAVRLYERLGFRGFRRFGAFIYHREGDPRHGE